VRLRQLEARIRELCSQAVTADDSRATKVLPELRLALHEHTQELRKTLAQDFGRGKGHKPVTEGKIIRAKQ
jgi:hypothetical protein